MLAFARHGDPPNESAVVRETLAGAGTPYHTRLSHHGLYSSRVPGGGVRDRKAWQDKGHRVTLINDKDEGGERDGEGQDGRAGTAAQGGG